MDSLKQIHDFILSLYGPGQPYRSGQLPHIPHYGPGHAGGSPSGPIIEPGYDGNINPYGGGDDPLGASDPLGSYVGVNREPPPVGPLAQPTGPAMGVAPTAPPNYPSWPTPPAPHPATGLPSQGSASLANAPMPPPRPVDTQQPRGLDPAKTDLGMNPRFSTFQYQVPSGQGPLSRNPIYTALNLGGQG